jgi:hypothetical protein
MLFCIDMWGGCPVQQFHVQASSKQLLETISCSNLGASVDAAAPCSSRLYFCCLDVFVVAVGYVIAAATSRQRAAALLKQSVASHSC